MKKWSRELFARPQSLTTREKKKVTCANKSCSFRASKLKTIYEALFNCFRYRFNFGNISVTVFGNLCNKVQTGCSDLLRLMILPKIPHGTIGQNKTTNCCDFSTTCSIKNFLFFGTTGRNNQPGQNDRLFRLVVPKIRQLFH